MSGFILVILALEAEGHLRFEVSLILKTKSASLINTELGGGRTGPGATLYTLKACHQ